MPSALINGVSLNYKEQGSGPPLVLMHPSPVGADVWADQLSFFAQFCRVIAFDCRGFGLSTAPTDATAYSPEQMVEDTYALLDRLEALPAVICGLSMGGNIALNAALKYPSAVRGLVLCGTGTGSDDPVAFKAGCEKRAQDADKGAEAFFDSSTRVKVFADFMQRGPREAALMRELLLAQPAHGMAMILRHVVAPRTPIYALGDGMKQLRIPTLVMFGEHEQGSLKPSQFIADAIPGARLEVLAGANHFINLETPDLFNAALLSFLRENGFVNESSSRE